MSCHDHFCDDAHDDGPDNYGDVYEHNFPNNDDPQNHDGDGNIDELHFNNDGDHNHDRDCNIDNLQSHNDPGTHVVQRYGDRNQDRECDSDRYFDNVQSDHDQNSDKDDQHNPYGSFHKDLRHDHRSGHCLEHGLRHGNHNWLNRDGDSDRDVVHDDKRHQYKYKYLHCDGR